VSLLVVLIVLGSSACLGEAPGASGPGGDASGAAAARKLIDAGKYGDAEAAARGLLHDLEGTATVDEVAVAGALDLLVESLWRGGKSKQPEALESAERALALKEHALGPEDAALVASLQNVATVLRLRGELDRSQPLHERALAISQKQFGPGHPETIKVLTSLGNLLKDRGDHAGASEFYQKALELGETAYGPEDRQVAIILNNLGSTYQEAGEYARAVPIQERALAIMKAVHADAVHPEVAFVLNAYAGTLWRLGEYGRARDLHEEALAIREKVLGPDHHSVAASLNNLALVLGDQGDLAGARPYLERAVAIWEKGLGLEHPLTAQGYNNLGTLMGRLGDLDRARRLEEQALGIREKQLGPDNPLVAQTLINLGNVHSLVGDRAAARPLLERAVAVSERALGPDNPLTAMARHDLGQILLDLGETEAARTQLELALAVRERSLGSGHPQVAETLSALGELHRKSGAFDKAREFQSRALAIREAALGPDHPEVGTSRAILAAADLDLGRLDEARSEASAAAASNQRFLRSTLGAVSEREALLLLGRREHPEVTLFSALLVDEKNRQAWLSACWTWTLGQRGLVLEEMAARRRAAYVGGTDAVKEAWDRLAAARRLLAATWVRGVEEEKEAAGTEPYRKRLERATQEKEAAEIEMARTSARYRDESAALRATLDDVAGSLPEHTALVEVVRVPIRSPGSRDEVPHDIALILGKDGRTAYADLGRSSETDGLVAAWRRALDATQGGAAGNAGDARDGVAALMQAGWRLRRAIWEPVAERTRGVETIVLVPEASLWTINLAALPAEDGTFLIENGPRIQIIGAARDLVRGGRDAAESGGPPARGVLLVGAPDFGAPEAMRLAGIAPARREHLFRGAPSACGGVAKRDWPKLPEAGREIARVGSLFKKSESLLVLSGAMASEERFKLEAPGKRVLHLATHGYFHDERCASGERENPLLLSGLVLAGANAPTAPQADGQAATGIDDGVLTAEEVVALDLRGTGLAVLSACDTGRGDVEVGEGVFGLQRSLELAGVQAIVMSLWPVPDRDARRWMSSFYESLLAGAPVADASRQASVAALARLRAADRVPHPYFWGAFVSAGDWRATVRPKGLR
jgi:tetratricopeptide (TPR) repeat protein/CHAT domain-containing protein